jgi:arylsulfatase A-like enzyme
MNKRPNVLFLVLDTHRVERLSLYGYDRPTTPAIDCFAEDASVFDWAIAPAQWTVPSHASMFTGLYPTVHQTTQSYTALPDDIPTLAEILREHGYETVGFCNNPLIGVLDNDLSRGFNKFYNYSGTIPDVPRSRHFGRRRKHDAHLEELTEQAANRLRRITQTIERQFGRSALLLRLATMPIFVPIWSRTFNFKGNTGRSSQDVVDYLRYHRATDQQTPLFMFVNMMETHLPYYPPRAFVDRWAPYLRKDRQARDFMQRFNTQSYRWMAPVIEPLSEEETRVLHDMYDAEVAYQDRQLRRLFRWLRRSGELENTMVIITSDHGESHGEHNFMGHAFVIYNELVHVPLIIRYPRLFPAGQRVGHYVSIRRLFHTVLDAAGVSFERFEHTTEELSLARSIEGKDPADEVVAAEAFPPLNFIAVMEANNPEAIEPFRVRAMRRTIYDGSSKLMTVADRPDEFFDVQRDPLEEQNLLENPLGYENEVLRLERMLDDFVVVSEAHRDGTAAGRQIDLSNNPELLERLRGLGYIE